MQPIEQTQEAQLLTAIVEQAGLDFITSWDEAGIARLMGDAGRAQKHSNLHHDAKQFFLDGGARDVCGVDDDMLLRRLRAEIAIPRNWNRFKALDEAIAAWNEYADARDEAEAESRKPGSKPLRENLKSLHLWLAKKQVDENKTTTKH